MAWHRRIPRDHRGVERRRFYASRFGASGSMIVFGGGHNDYFGSDVHAFDLASREWRRISDGYIAGGERDYGTGAVLQLAATATRSPRSRSAMTTLRVETGRTQTLWDKNETLVARSTRSFAIDQRRLRRISTNIQPAERPLKKSGNLSDWMGPPLLAGERTLAARPWGL
jgi:hypothetical protein